MTDRDPAFLWETEALRTATHRVVEAELDTGDEEKPDGRWVTLREASRATGIPVETLRKWARRGTVPSYLSPTNRGTSLRMVDLNGVEVRAAELGRATTEASAADPAQATASVPDGTPPGTMIVPIDAWNKMLNQLGNLHEAGQQLAAARERAVKAETEAEFLRERLNELRSEQPATPSLEPVPPSEESAEQEPATEKVWQYLVRRYRFRRLG